MPIDIQECADHLRRQTARRQARLDDRFARATNEAGAIVAMIAARFKPRRIYQWGSLLDRSRFWERSDIDLAVEGVTRPEEFFALYGDAEKMSSFPLDLVAIENVEPEFAGLIRQNGRIVWQQPEAAHGR